MQLTPYQKKQLRFVLVLLLGIPATIFAVYKGVQYLSQATGDPTPQQVVISNVTNVSITLSWFTQKEVGIRYTCFRWSRKSSSSG